MNLGVCYGSPDTARIAEAGFDYVEYPTAALFGPAKDDEEHQAAREAILASPLPAPVCNLFFPGDMTLVGPDRELDRAVEYADAVFEHLRAIGTRIQVFGSGAARRVPDGYPQDKAGDELKELCRRIGPLAERHGITVAMEHLRAKECNILTSLAEALEFVRQVNHPAVQVLADGFHMAQMNEPYEIIGSCAERLVHVHVADPETRAEPSAAGSDLRPLFSELKAAGYDAGVSVECRWQDMDANLKATHDMLVAQWDEA